MIHDRLHAGKLLAEKLAPTIKGKNCLVLAIPRGGVIVGDEIARRLNLPLDIIISKKITPPDYPEYAVGAITYDGVLYYGHEWERYANDPRFEAEINKKKTEVTRQIEAYRGNTNYNFDDKTIILVDDGIATGATVCAILQWLLQKQVKEIILAIPVIPFVTQEIIKQFGIQIIALEAPMDFSSVGQFYRKFDQIPDQIVISILEKYKSK
ncbi:phosphoribosyltransferase [Candidatus Nitrosotenuis sp. DW1]|uniref:phosphoribosyltransferase n=1 Tax=Candidatus Nitrosotenuis sp. DW1 TaxID=2259672 RepID=UPI0015C84BC1|nr:phosphoribosyltransferase family protein [Candidatus Nitrosotenuis sp. DW1]QLH08256.1 phosphoribosyltransferase [Candidatus Nitrosotenuis sp. DW1]